MKKLNELTAEEVKELLKVNNYLREQAQAWADDNAQEVINECLRPFERMYGIDYNIGYPANYFSVQQGSYKDFLFACLDHEYKESLFAGFLAEIERASKRAYFFEDALNGYEDISDKNWKRLEKWMDNIVRIATESIVSDCTEVYENSYDEETITETALCFCENSDDLLTDGKQIVELNPRIYA